MKKALSVLLAFTMVLALLPAGSLLASAYTSGDYTYTVSNSQATITKYNGTGSNVVIPGTLGGYTVTGINGSLAFPTTGVFTGCPNLTTVTIPDSVTLIGDYSFYNCSGLTSVNIPGNVTTIGTQAFYNCTGLTGISIPNSVTVLGSKAFQGCSKVTGLTIGTGVTSLNDYQFYGCSKLTSVSIPDSVTVLGSPVFGSCSELVSVSIGKGLATYGSLPFPNCKKLTQITVDSQNGYFSARDNVLFNKAQTTLVFCPVTRAGDYVIPDGVTTIGTSAFRDCSLLTSITLPASLATITDGALYGCTGLHDIFVVSGSTSFSSQNGVLFNADKTSLVYCLRNKTGSYSIPGSVKSIAYSAFGDCTGLTGITIPNGVTSIGVAAFNDCTSLTNIIIPDSVQSIGKQAFYGCTGLTNLTIGSGVKTIEESAFLSCSGLTSIIIPGSITSLGYGLFSCCNNLVSVTIESGITQISESLFSSCNKLTSVSIPNTVKTIVSGAFQNCKSLKSITLPSSITSLKASAFAGDTLLSSAYFYGNAPAMETNVFQNCASGFTVYHLPDKTGFTSPTWQGYPTAVFTMAGSITITFDANGGTGGTSTSMNAGDPLTAPTVTRTGYTLTGWSPTVPATVPAANTTYIAQWAINAYTITFNSNGGSSVTPVTQNYNTSVTKPVDPTKAGYNFAGWYSDAGLTNAVVWPVALTANITLYAKWAVNCYTITFDANGGTGGTSTSMNAGDPLTAPTVTRAGYTFAGWSPEVPATVPAYNATYAAQWSKNLICITFVPGGSFWLNPGEPIQVPTVTKTGYSFAGWSPAVPYSAPDFDMTFYAQWAINAYTITFDANGGSAVSAITQDYNTSISKPTDPTKTGYTFAGWYTDAALTNEVAWPYTIGASDVTFYAKWTASASVHFTVSSASGMTGDIITVSVTVSENSNLGAITLVVPYDSAVLEVVSYNAGSILNGFALDVNNNETALTITLAAARTTKLTAGGSILDIQFRIKGSAPAGKINTGAYISELTDTGIPANPLSFDITQGSITVVCKLGDINGSGTVTAVDALMVLQAATGRITLTAEQLLAADVNKSGTVTALDALMILQYATGKITSFN